MGKILTVKINGVRQELLPGTTIEDILVGKSIRPEIVAVELNGMIMKDYKHFLEDGDSLEFMAYMAGGTIC